MSAINVTTTYNAIAQQCPLPGGLAVFMAQTIIKAQSADIEFNVDSLCALAGYRIEIGPYYTTNNQFDLAIYPNPTSNEIYIKCIEEIYSIKLYSLYGELLIQKHLKSKNTRLDVSQLGSGIYFISALSSNKIYTKKLQIIK